jgi:hypothetical protein
VLQRKGIEASARWVNNDKVWRGSDLREELPHIAAADIEVGDAIEGCIGLSVEDGVGVELDRSHLLCF